MNRLMLGVLMAAAAAMIPASRPALAGSTGECVSVQVDAPFRLPDGVLRSAGVLTLCDSRAFSPVTELHVILVNGSRVGAFQSRRRSAETGPVEAPEVVFERDAQGTLGLVGYILPAAGRSLSFRLRGEGESWQASRRGPISGSSSEPVAAIVAAAGTR